MGITFSGNGGQSLLRIGDEEFPFLVDKVNPAITCKLNENHSILTHTLVLIAGTVGTLQCTRVLPRER